MSLWDLGGAKEFISMMPMVGGDAVLAIGNGQPEGSNFILRRCA